MKIKFDSEDDLSLKKKLKLCKMVVVLRSAFHDNNKYYPHVFLDEYLYKLFVLYLIELSFLMGLMLIRQAHKDVWYLLLQVIFG